MHNLRTVLATIFVCALQATLCHAQSTLTGKILDKKTGEPVPYANVYFAHTTMGVASNPDGTFVISKIPNGKYDLLVESVGYRQHRQPLEFQEGKYNIEIELEEEVKMLQTVTIVAGRDEKKYYPVFFRWFVGDGKNARKCEIQNRDALYFSYDSARNTLTVQALEPIRVSNLALGYTVHFTLDRFELDFTNGAKLMEGNPRFVEHLVRTKRDSVALRKARDQAYRGSLYHFMKALYNYTLEEEKFSLYIVDTTKSSPDKELLVRFDTEKQLIGTEVKRLNITGLLKVEYRENEALEYPGRYSISKANPLSNSKAANPKGFQQTYLKLKGPNLDIYQNGYYADQRSVFMNGYLVWSSVVSNMVPLEHELQKSKKKKKKAVR